MKKTILLPIIVTSILSSVSIFAADAKDLGIVFLPNFECKKFADHMTNLTEKKLKSSKKIRNTPHITAIHIANLDASGVNNVKQEFKRFSKEISKNHIELPILTVNATGGTPIDGYKWLDLQFKGEPLLLDIRNKAVDIFCPFHNGVLTRMNDDITNFNEDQKEQIKRCGVTYKNYIPHITTWYVNLPIEAKTLVLEDLAREIDTEKLSCHVESIALVELGRNGNVVKIIDRHALK